MLSRLPLTDYQQIQFHKCGGVECFSRKGAIRLTGTWAGQKRVEHEQKKLMAENKPFFDALIGKRDLAAAGADAILKNDLNALAASERFTEIVEKAPRVRDHFTAAFAREIAKRETPVPQPKQPKPGFKL